MKKVGIAIPVANEEKGIQAFLDELFKELDRLQFLFTVYIVMDSFSRDGTMATVQRNAAKDSRVRLIFFKESTGVASCYLEGFKRALEDNCDYVIEMDSGGSHPPSRISAILYALDTEGYDVVFMSRFMKGGDMSGVAWYRRLISKGGTMLANLWLGMHLTDGTSGFEAFRAEVLRSLNFGAFLSRGGIYQTEMKYYCSGFTAKEVPFRYVGSVTTFKFEWLPRALRTLFKMKSNRKYALRNL